MSATLHCIEAIETALSGTGWNKARVKLLARFLVALIGCRTVCLARLANALPGEAKAQSHYKRLKRFVRQFELSQAVLARLVLTLTQAIPPFALALDRTNWKLGKAEINILMLALIHPKWPIAFPLFWSVLGKAGNSALAERVALLRHFLATFGKESIDYLCADREFGGEAFARWLMQQDIPFVLRIRGNVTMTNAQGDKRTARGLFWHGRVGAARDLGQRRVFVGSGAGLWLHVAGMRVRGGDFAIVISNIVSNRAVVEGSGEDLLARYGRRWGIETLFGCLKRRGFDLEATHLTASDRLSRLLGVLTLAYCWAYVAGEWLYEQCPWRVKKHGRLIVSLFRRGLDWLQRLFLPLCGNYSQQEATLALQFLSRT
jgi:hypothetical protein